MAPFNKFNKVLKPIALSNTRFYEKILGKYRKNKKINSGFPILFLYKTRNHEGPRKIDFSIHWLLDLQSSFSCVLTGLEKMVRNSTDTGKRTLMLQPGKTVLNFKILRIGDTKGVQDKSRGKCKSRYFSVREKLLDERAKDSVISVLGIYDKVGARVEDPFLLKKSTSISFSAPVSSSSFRMGSIRLQNKKKFLGTNKRSFIQKNVMLTAVSKVWMGVSGRKAFTAFERVIHPVESAISSAKKPVMSVEQTFPALEETEGSIVGSSFPTLDIPVLDTTGSIVKAVVPDILSGLQTEAYGVEVKSAVENHYKSGYNPAEGTTLSEVYPPLSGKNDLFTPAVEDLYFFNRRQIGQELQKIKETISGLEKSVSEKLITSSLPEKASTRNDQEIGIISEHVYKSIERRIRMEREMRGL